MKTWGKRGAALGKWEAAGMRLTFANTRGKAVWKTRGRLQSPLWAFRGKEETGWVVTVAVSASQTYTRRSWEVYALVLHVTPPASYVRLHLLLRSAIRSHRIRSASRAEFFMSHTRIVQRALQNTYSWGPPWGSWFCRHGVEKEKFRCFCSSKSENIYLETPDVRCGERGSVAYQAPHETGFGVGTCMQKIYGQVFLGSAPAVSEGYSREKKLGCETVTKKDSFRLKLLCILVQIRSL